MSLARTLRKQKKREAEAYTAGMKLQAAQMSNDALSPRAKFGVDDIFQKPLQFDPERMGFNQPEPDKPLPTLTEAWDEARREERRLATTVEIPNQ